MSRRIPRTHHIKPDVWVCALGLCYGLVVAALALPPIFLRALGVLLLGLMIWDAARHRTHQPTAMLARAFLTAVAAVVPAACILAVVELAEPGLPFVAVLPGLVLAAITAIEYVNLRVELTQAACDRAQRAAAATPATPRDTSAEA
jgi:hypothetical protein